MLWLSVLMAVSGALAGLILYLAVFLPRSVGREERQRQEVEARLVEIEQARREYFGGGIRR